MSKFVNQIYSPHSLTTFSFGVSSLRLIFSFSVATFPLFRHSSFVILSLFRHTPPSAYGLRPSASSSFFRWCELVARTHFAKDNFPLCYDPTLPSLFPSLHSPFEGSQRQLDMLEKRYFYHITCVIRHSSLVISFFFSVAISPLSLGEGRGEDSFSFVSKPRFYHF